MADWQHAFLSKVILELEMKEAVTANITTAFFRDERYQRVYEYMLSHWTRHGSPPDEDVVRQAFPTLEWKPQRQALSYLIDQMRRDRMFVILTQGLSAAADFIADENAVEMQATLTEALTQAKLETSPAQDMDVTQYRLTFMELLQERMDNPGMLRGISSGYSGIDYVTGGWQPEQFVVLLGVPKSFKSATLLSMALAAHVQGQKPLFVGFEMSSGEQIDRLVSLLSHVSLTKIMRGTLSGKEEKEIDKALRSMESMRSFFFSTDISAGSTVGNIQGKIIDYQPDVVFIDGAYLMQSEMSGVQQGTPQALTDISRSLKRLAQQQKLPVVVSTQATLVRSKGGLSLASGMYTQAWGQDCDVLLGVERDRPDRPDQRVEEDTDASVMVKLRVLESRSGPRKDTLLEWNWSKGAVAEIDPAKMRELLDRKNRHQYLHDTEDGM